MPGLPLVGLVALGLALFRLAVRRFFLGIFRFENEISERAADADQPPACLGVFGELRALAFEPASMELLGRVDALLRAQDSSEERLLLYRAALDHVTDPVRRRELIHGVASIERGALGDAAAAVLTYRRALAEDSGDRAALAALLEIHEAAGAWDDLYAELTRAHALAAEGRARRQEVLLLN